jgi:hypothetical protein
MDMAPSVVGQLTSLNTLRTTFGSPPVQIFVFASDANYQNFFDFTPSGVSGAYNGYTTKFGSSNTIYAAVMEANLSTVQNMKEIAAHELGHAINIIDGDQSNNTTLETYVAEDFMYLDYSAVTGSSGTARPPCGSGAPFNGVLDETNGLSICVSAATTGYTMIGPNLYIETKFISSGTTPMRNSLIIQGASPGIFVWNTTDGWKELYAQSFGWEIYTSTSPVLGFYYSTADNILNQNYFQCQTEWSYDVVNNATVPPTTPPSPYHATGFGSCASAPSWYRTILGH